MHNPHGIKLLTRLRVGLNHLREHKFRHNFQDSLDPFCNCGRHIETTIHFFLRCSNYSNQRKTLFEKNRSIKRSLLNQNDSIIVETLIFGSTGLNDEENACIIESTPEYITTTEIYHFLVQAFENRCIQRKRYLYHLIKAFFSQIHTRVRQKHFFLVRQRTQSNFFMNA